MFRTSFIIAAILPLMLFGQSAEANDEFIFILQARGNPYWHTLAQGIEDTAKEKNVAAKVYMQEAAAAAEEQLNQCEAALGRNPKVLVLSSVNPNEGIQCLKKAQAKGVIIADVDSSLQMDVALKSQLKLAFSVGSDNYKIGSQAADLAATLADGKPMRILILEGATGSNAARGRADGFRQRIQEVAPNITIVASISATWDRLKATTITTDILTREATLGLIYSANDQMALGASEAVRVAGRTGTIKIIGVDGTADARKAILENRMSATVAQLPYLIGKRSIELALDATKSEMIGRNEVTPTPVLTKAMIESGQDPLLQYVK